VHNEKGGAIDIGRALSNHSILGGSLKDGLDNAVFDQPLTLDFTFQAELQVERVLFDPPIAGTSSYEVIDDRLRLYMVPDEQRYTFILE
jgi:hypothetical protein